LSSGQRGRNEAGYLEGYQRVTREGIPVIVSEGPQHGTV